MKKIAAVLSINILVFLIGLVVVELIFGSWLYQRNFGDLTIPRDIVISSDTSALYPEGGEIRVTKDKNGFRSTRDVKLSEVDFLFVGGSTTLERYVDDCCNWTSVFRDAAVAKGMSVNVLNAGVDGQSTLGHIWNFEGWFPRVPDLRMRYVVAYIGINERPATADEEASFVEKAHYEDPLRKLRQYLRNNSVILNVLRVLQGSAVAYQDQLSHSKLDYSSAVWLEAPLADLDALACPAWVSTDLSVRLDALVETILKMGAMPILATQQRGDSYVQEGVWRYMSGTVSRPAGSRIHCINQKTLAFCEARGIRCLDIASVPLDRETDFYDYVHTTPSGSQKIGQAFADLLFEMLEAGEN